LISPVFRNRFAVVPRGTFSVAHETCRAAPAIAVIIILVTNAPLVADASAVAMPEHIGLQQSHCGMHQCIEARVSPETDVTSDQTCSPHAKFPGALNKVVVDVG
jgi:hypothetical protein